MKILISDIDDTLYSHVSNCIPQVTKTALWQLVNKGVPVVFCTARVLYGTRIFLKELGVPLDQVYLVASNGTEVVKADTMEHWYQATIDEALVSRVEQLAVANNIAFGFDQPQCLVINQYNQLFAIDHYALDIDLVVTNHPMQHLKTPTHKLSLTMDPSELDRMEALLHQTFNGALSVTRAGSGYLDIVAAKHDKRTGVEHLLTKLNLTLADVVYVGDGLNDLSMMEVAGLSACVANARPACHEICHKILPSCEAGGVAQLISEVWGHE